jgi:hypothetical protein
MAGICSTQGGRACEVLVRKPEDENHLGNLGAYGNVILKWILKKDCGLDSVVSRYGPVAGSCEHGNESLSSIKGEEFLTY